MKPELYRRDFLKLLGAGISYLAISTTFAGLTSCITKNNNQLFSIFQQPPSQAKPFYRWWWNGNRVTKGEVIRELEIMKNAGAGGVEINPIAINPVIKNPVGEPLNWLSKEWIEVLQTAIKKGDDLGMITDMIIGTGWPFGGKFLKDEETIQGLDVYTEKVNGPGVYSFDSTNLKKEAVIKQATLIPNEINQINQIQNITEQISNAKIEIPKGEYTLVVISWRNKFREVTNGAPGGDGPVLDHFNKQAVEKYLQRTENGLKPYLGENFGESIRSMFCDSIELSGANWTSDFREVFKTRNNYDVWPYLSLILNSEIKAENDFADTILRVRYDYYSTLSEIFTERFILTFHNWCKKIGVQSRYQAYGHPWIPTDLLDGNLIPDIPEGDQWLFNGGWTATQLDEIRYAIWDKYTSSAAHLRGLKIASCEAMTNTSGVFSASLEYIKQATDINIVAGINHLVLHGWNYSPPEAGFPGWIRFGTWFNEKNPWFPYLKNWSDYTARLCSVLQNSQAVSQVAIIGPTADRWSESGLERNAFLTQPWYLHSLWQAINHHGYCSDYLNPRIFSNATYENGKINYGPMSYQAVIICGMKTVLPEFIDSLVEYAQSGGKIIFVGETPDNSPGMKYKNSNAVAKKMHPLLYNFTDNVFIADEPQKENITEWAGKLLQAQKINPGIKISLPNERLFHFQAKSEESPIYFFSNQNREKSIVFDATFPHDNMFAWKWDAETGEKSLFSLNKKTVGIFLKPLESLLLVFDKKPGNMNSTPSFPKGTSVDLSTNWEAEFITPENHRFSKKLKQLTDLSKLEETKNFGGKVIYRKTFQSAKKSILDLGKVAETAEVILNGKNLGVKYWGERQFDIREACVDGENSLEIIVTTLLWNYCNSFSMDENPSAKSWANRNRNKSNKPLATGLIGPVKLR